MRFSSTEDLRFKVIQRFIEDTNGEFNNWSVEDRIEAVNNVVNKILKLTKEA